MKTYHVGGFNPINRFKTLKEALESKKVQDDDTIVIHKNLNETVKVTKNVIIQGNGHTFSVEQGKAGIKTVSPCEIHNLKFSVQPRANAILAQNDILLDQIEVSLNGPIRAFYPLVLVQGAHKVVISSSKLMLLSLDGPTRSEITDTEFLDYYPGNVMLSTRDNMSVIYGDTTIDNCRLHSIRLSGNATIKNSQLDRFVDIDGLKNVKVQTTLTDCVIDTTSQQVKKNAFKKEPKSGPLKNRLDNKYVLALRPDSNVRISNLQIQQTQDGFMGIFGEDTNLIYQNTNLSDQGIKNRLVDSNLSLKKTNDQNFWQLDGKTSAAYVRSKLNASMEYETAMEKLDKMIGQQGVKDKIHSIMNTINQQNATDNKDFSFSYHMIFAGDPGTGKCEPMFAKIHTPQGVRRFGDLKPGDEVFGRLGQVTKVLGIFLQGKKEVYRVTLADGRTMLCNDEHIFNVIDNKRNRHGKNQFENHTLREMIDMGIFYQLGKSTSMRKRWAVPKNEAVEMPTRTLPLDPYVLGAFIGDGCLTDDMLEISSDDPFVVHKIAKIIHAEGIQYDNRPYKWNFKAFEPFVSKTTGAKRFMLHTDDIIPEELQKVKSINRFIPREYLDADIEQRLELLQGLFDTDGTITEEITSHGKHKYKVSYSTNSKQLAEDVRELMFSLGFGSTLRIEKRHDNLHKNLEYTVHATVEPEEKQMFFTLPRKKHLAQKAALHPIRHDYSKINIVKVEDLGYTEEMMCIYVDNPEHLYLSNEYIVTHNTTIGHIVSQALYEIGAIPENKFTFVDSSDIVQGYIGQTGQKMREILDKAIGGVLFIDEAYQLTVKKGEKSFNSEAITPLVQYMDAHRTDLVVIAAGYNKEMKEFMASNVGFTRRFQWIQFENYTSNELAEIFDSMRESYGDKYADPKLDKLIAPLFHKVTQTYLSIPDANGRITNGGNGGLARNIYQDIATARNNRIANTSDHNQALEQQDILIGFKQQLIKANNLKL